MRGYVEKLEWLEKCREDDSPVTCAEVLAAMADEQAARIDAARDAAKYDLIDYNDMER